jgi:hypothetical protein
MSYWWVNQGDSFEEARKLGALWAPLEDKGGKKQPSWESLDLVKPGDIVFHFAKKMVRGISLVTSESRVAEIRIRDRGQWQDLGREIEVEAQDFDFTINLNEIPLELRIGSESGIDTPFDKNGKVKQGYLFKFPQAGAQFLLTRLNLVNSEDERSLDNQVKELLGDFSGGTDKPITGTFRREQRALRQHLIGNKKSGECGICGRSLSSNLLVASHIKPRSECTEKERIDPSVVMLACVLGCDSLFDKGFIYIDQKGIIKVSRKTDGYPDLSQFVSAIEGRVAKAFSENAKDFFSWHERNLALKTQK